MPDWIFAIVFIFGIGTAFYGGMLVERGRKEVRKKPLLKKAESALRHAEERA